MPELQFLKIAKVFLDVFKSYKNYFLSSLLILVPSSISVKPNQINIQRKIFIKEIKVKKNIKKMSA